MIDFLLSIEEHKKSTIAVKHGKSATSYLLSTILFLCFACKWQGLRRGK